MFKTMNSGNPWRANFRSYNVKQSWKFARKLCSAFLWVPAELAPFFSQHHKWSRSRPEWSTVRTLLCADSIRNNCILASLHSSPLTTMVGHSTVFLCCKYSMITERGKGHCSSFFNLHISLDCTSCTEPPMIFLCFNICQQHLALRQPVSHNWSAILISLHVKLALQTMCNDRT